MIFSARSTLLCVLVFFMQFSARAAVSEFELLLDLDNNSASGCSVNTPDGTFYGVEKILVTTADADTVLGIATQDCVDPATNQFDARVQTSTGGWPVGKGLGDAGSDVIETVLALYLEEGSTLRAGLLANSGNNSDALSFGSGVGPQMRAPSGIPGLGQFGMLLLAMLLALAAYRMLRAHPNVFGALLFVVLAGSGVRVAWAAFNLDGQIGDWAGFSPIATDPQGDPKPDLVSLYGYAGANQLMFRFDVFLNAAPLVSNDSYRVDEDVMLSVPAPGVLGNDSDVNNDGLTVELVTGPANAQAFTLNADGSFNYQAVSDYYAADTFTYRAFDGIEYATQVARVDITVNPVNDQVTANNDGGFNTPANTPVTGVGDLLANDLAPDGGLAAVAATTTSAQGAAVTIYIDGNFDYDPTGSVALQALLPGESLADSFSYTARDIDGDTATATVSISVSGLDDPVTANNDSDYVTDEDTPLAAAGNLLANDLAPDGGLVAVATTITSTQGASVTIYADGTFDYDPTAVAAIQAMTAGESISDTFIYAAKDVDGDTATATVTVIVNGLNEAPAAITVPVETFDVIGNTAFEYSDSQSISPGVFLAGNLLSNFAPDPDGPAALSASLNSATVGASVTVNTDGSFSYIPPAGLTGNDTFSYSVTDGLATVMRTVTINLQQRVWYVQNNSATGGSGRSSDPFDTLHEAEVASLPGDYIFIYRGDGTTSGQDAGIELKDQQKLYGESYGLSIPVNLNGQGSPTNLVSANTIKPVITNTAGHGVTVLANASNGPRTGIEIRGLEINDASGNGVDINGALAQASSVIMTDNVVVARNNTVDPENLLVGVNLDGKVDVSIERNDFSGGGAAVSGIDITGNQTVSANTIHDIVNGFVYFYDDITSRGILLINNAGSSNLDVSSNIITIGSVANTNQKYITALELTGGSVVSSNNTINLQGIIMVGQRIYLGSGQLNNNTIDIYGEIYHDDSVWIFPPSTTIGQHFSGGKQGVVTVSDNSITMDCAQDKTGQLAQAIDQGATLHITNNNILIKEEQSEEVVNIGQDIMFSNAVDVVSSGNTIAIYGPGLLVGEIRWPNVAANIWDVSDRNNPQPAGRGQVTFTNNQITTEGEGVYINGPADSNSIADGIVKVIDNTIVSSADTAPWSVEWPGIYFFDAPYCMEISGNTANEIMYHTLAGNTDPNRRSNIANANDEPGLAALNPGVVSMQLLDPLVYQGVGNFCIP